MIGHKDRSIQLEQSTYRKFSLFSYQYIQCLKWKETQCVHAHARETQRVHVHAADTESAFLRQVRKEY